MKVLITGAGGQLGRDLVLTLEGRFEVIGLGRSELDITDQDLCLRLARLFKPQVIIHAAAYTAVDKAESDSDEAFRVNAMGTRNMAVAAEDVGAKLCYISTDYVFDGTASVPYNEYDNTNPSSVYGKSKRAGEVLVQSLCRSFFIVRTSWVYGPHGSNFVKTMINLAKDRKELKVVHDQVGSPTYTEDLCSFILQLIQTDKFGIYHAANSGICSWYEFAKAIFEEARVSIDVQPCTTVEFPRPAPRPHYSVFDRMAIRTNGFSDLRPWREALKDFLAKLNS